MNITRYSIVGIFIFLLDRMTKLWAVSACATEQQFTSWLSCSVAFNRGVSWSLFHSTTSIVFVLVTAAVVGALALVAYHAWQRVQAGLHIWPEMLIVAGALGNIVDRFWYGGVVDFIGLSYNNFYWPLFNVADIAIVVGIFLMMIEMVRS